MLTWLECAEDAEDERYGYGGLDVPVAWAFVHLTICACRSKKKHRQSSLKKEDRSLNPILGLTGQ